MILLAADERKEAKVGRHEGFLPVCPSCLSTCFAVCSFIDSATKAPADQKRGWRKADNGLAARLTGMGGGGGFGEGNEKGTHSVIRTMIMIIQLAQ